MKEKSYLLIELFILFILLPVSFALDYWVVAKGVITLIGLGYIIFVLKRVEHMSFSIKKDLDWKAFWKQMIITGTIVVMATTAFVLYKDPKALFYVPRTNVFLFIAILFVYTFLSVGPQELVYRTFFFQRYERLFSSKTLLIFLNATIFSLAHIFFKNTLVLILTFIGGLLFGYTYLRFKSTTMVTIEHALYGNWLFTVGMGQMLAFPGMEN